jgi:Pyridoxamine 5'-phosphate oxidase
MRASGLPSCALSAEAAQRAFELRHTCSDTLEVLIGEREEPHWRTRHDCGRPFSRQEECDLTERVAGAESLVRLATLGQNIGVALFDEVDGGSVVVERDDLGTGLDLDLAHGGRKLVELRRRKIGKELKCCDPTRIHGRGSCHREQPTATHRPTREMIWRDLEAAAPELARLGKERLEQKRVALLGTLRRDGSPRISPVEPFLTQGHLLFGAMSWSMKTRDLVRDPRCALHSAVADPDSGEGELKLYGRATKADDRLRDAPREAWWVGRPSEAASVFSLDIEQATFITWDLEHGEMTVRRWSPQRGYTEATRSYP